MITEEIGIHKMLYRIEDRIGVLDSKDDGSITAELSSLRGIISPMPHIEIDIPITGDTFEVQHSPVVVGDSSVVNGHAIISIGSIMGMRRLEEWRDISFSGRIGTIVGANGRYDGKEITLTYFYSPIPTYTIAISDGFMTTTESSGDSDDIIILDVLSGNTYKMAVLWDRSTHYLRTRKISPTNDMLTDLSTGVNYRVFLKNEVIEYEEV